MKSAATRGLETLDTIDFLVFGGYIIPDTI